MIALYDYLRVHLSELYSLFPRCDPVCCSLCMLVVNEWTLRYVRLCSDVLSLVWNMLIKPHLVYSHKPPGCPTFTAVRFIQELDNFSPALFIPQRPPSGCYLMQPFSPVSMSCQGLKPLQTLAFTDLSNTGVWTRPVFQYSTGMILLSVLGP